MKLRHREPKYYHKVENSDQNYIIDVEEYRQPISWINRNKKYSTHVVQVVY